MKRPTLAREQKMGVHDICHYLFFCEWKLLMKAISSISLCALSRQGDGWCCLSEWLSKASTRRYGQLCSWKSSGYRDGDQLPWWWEKRATVSRLFFRTNLHDSLLTPLHFLHNVFQNMAIGNDSFMYYAIAKIQNKTQMLLWRVYIMWLTNQVIWSMIGLEGRYEPETCG